MAKLTDSELSAICVSDIKYFDKLHEFSQKVAKVNESAINGMPILTLKSQMKKQVLSYMDLCGIESEEVRSLFEKKKIGRPSNNRKITVEVPAKNHIRTGEDNWLLCPKCGGKLVKANKDSVFVNCPIWCKRCKNAINVSWSIAP